jgi:isoleucyl-tRNA synthetase
MVRWIAPILSFTAEEAWKFLPEVANESVFLNLWHKFPAGAERAPALDWDVFITLKSDVAREMERFRAAGVIGSSLEADITIHVDAPLAARYGALGDELRFLLITSEANVVQTAAPAESAVKSSQEGVWIEVKPSTAAKCVRCYQLRSDVGSDSRHPEICARCVSNVEGPGEERRFA